MNSEKEIKRRDKRIADDKKIIEELPQTMEKYGIENLSDIIGGVK